jgi:hypothetical protein
MNEYLAIRRNFGQHIVEDFDNIVDTIKDVLEGLGYERKGYDICTGPYGHLNKEDMEDSKVIHIIFRRVHFSIPTMLSIPYDLITLIKEG